MGNVDMLSRRLRQLREEAGLSQSQLADELSVSRGSISYYENGDRTPDVEFLMKAKEYFGVDYEYLLGETSIRNKNDRSGIEKTMDHLSERKSSCIFSILRLLIQCAELYDKIPALDGSEFFEYLTADINQYIEAYKNIPYDLQRYDELCTIKRFLDRIVHTNAPDIIYHVSRLELSKNYTETEKGATYGEHQED